MKKVILVSYFIYLKIFTIYMKQFDLAPPSSLDRAEASFGRVHLTALGGGFGSYSKRKKMIMVMMIYSL